jgi:hypothetical protein
MQTGKQAGCKGKTSVGKGLRSLLASVPPVVQHERAFAVICERHYWWCAGRRPHNEGAAESVDAIGTVVAMPHVGACQSTQGESIPMCHMCLQSFPFMTSSSTARQSIATQLAMHISQNQPVKAWFQSVAPHRASHSLETL